MIVFVYQSCNFIVQNKITAVFIAVAILVGIVVLLTLV